MIYSSVLDPDAKRDPDLYVFGPPGSINYLYGFESESSSKSNKQNMRKNLDFLFL
jgi:hypothetical protein